MDAKSVGVGRMTNPNISRQSTSKSQHHGSVKTANYSWYPDVDMLGVGATCTAYKCRDIKTGAIYAVKLFDKAQPQYKEINVLKQLQHPNIVKFIALEDTELTADHPRLTALILEYCDGKTLHDHIKVKENWHGLADHDFLQLLYNVSEGLSYLYEQKYIHRDIKPANILRCWSSTADVVYKLGDFGSSRPVVEDEYCYSLQGTHEYLHPKIYSAWLCKNPNKSEGGYRSEADLWSLGVTLYQAASGRLPFRPFHSFRENHNATLKMIMEKPEFAICGEQNEENGQVAWSEQLPADCRMSRTVAKWISEVLQNLLRMKNSWTPDKLFSDVNNHKNTHLVYYFLASSHSVPDVCFCAKQTYQSLTQAITDSNPTLDQLTLYSHGHKLDKFPQFYSQEDPILVFQTHDLFAFSSEITDYDKEASNMKLKDCSMLCEENVRVSNNDTMRMLKWIKEFMADALRIALHCRRVSNNYKLICQLLERCMDSLVHELHKEVEQHQNNSSVKKELYGTLEKSLKHTYELQCLVSIQVGSKNSSPEMDSERNFPNTLKTFYDKMDEYYKFSDDYYQKLITMDKLRCKFNDLLGTTQRIHCNHTIGGKCELDKHCHDIEEMQALYETMFEEFKQFQKKNPNQIPSALVKHIFRLFKSDGLMVTASVEKVRKILSSCCQDELMRTAQAYEKWLKEADKNVSQKLRGLQEFVCSVEDSFKPILDSCNKMRCSSTNNLRSYFEQRNNRRNNQLSTLSNAVSNLLSNGQELCKEFVKNQQLLQELDELSRKNSTTDSTSTTTMSINDQQPTENQQQSRAVAALASVECSQLDTTTATVLNSIPVGSVV